MHEFIVGFKTLLMLISYAAVGYFSFLAGKSQMHTELTDDMKRYNDAPIPCRNDAGTLYLYSNDTKCMQWERKRKDAEY